MMEMKKYIITDLKRALITLLGKQGVDSYQSGILIDCMIEADMRGVHTHGLSVLPAYIKKINNGSFNLNGNNTVIKSTPAFSIIDANGRIGAVSATECMDMAISTGMKNGIYTVFCRNANTFGAAFYYTKMATDRKMIGICLSNTPSAMPVWGGSKKMLGTNPFSIGIPANNHSPIIVDMATSIVAKSKINEIRKNGGTIPKGWAVDSDGNPTTDPEAALQGMVLPMAAHKGSAIAMAIDIIAGVLSGAGFLNNVNRFYSEQNECMNVGQCFIVIDPSSIYGDDFYNQIDNYITEVHLSGENVFYPGEKESILYAESLEKGVELSKETSEALSELFLRNNISGALIEYVG